MKYYRMEFIADSMERLQEVIKETSDKLESNPEYRAKVASQPPRTEPIDMDNDTLLVCSVKVGWDK